MNWEKKLKNWGNKEKMIIAKEGSVELKGSEPDVITELVHVTLAFRAELETHMTQEQANLVIMQAMSKGLAIKDISKQAKVIKMEIIKKGENK